LTAGYHGAAVVRGLALYVEAGEVVALLGPNGAGKTTTLLTISGLLKPLEGEVLLDGLAVTGWSADKLARAGLVHVPEDRALFAQLTVGENLRLGRAPGGQNLARVLRWFPALEPLLDRKAGLLSGGEQQMLAVGRALLGEPRVLLLDELSLGLAPVIVAHLLELVPEIAAETGCGVLLVEQHIEMALRAATRGYILRRGEVVMSGDSDTLLADRSLLTSSYLGA
jgi:branched-chain amino acid transport system ATP-binding protein